MLTQKQGDMEHVLAYALRFLNKAERNYGVTHLEHLAVVFGMEKFEPYVAGNQ